MRGRGGVLYDLRDRVGGLREAAVWLHVHMPIHEMKYTGSP
jgi:hypothetical protein